MRPCEARFAQLAEALEQGGALPQELHAHALSCAGCRAAVVAWSRQARALRSMPRVAAPRELDGLVVAALHAGARQERALREVAALPRVQAPDALDARMEQLLAGPHTTSARFAAGESDGRVAPEELRGLVGRDLAHEGRARRAARRRALAGAFTLSLLALCGALLLWPRGGETADDVAQAEGPQIELVVVQSLDDLDPLTRSVLEGVAGGRL